MSIHQCMLHDADSRIDPTRTRVIRRSFARVLDTKWRAVSKLVSEALIEKDFFGVGKETAQSIQVISQSSGKVEAFQRWFDATLNQIVLSDRGLWMTMYVQQGYNSGVKYAMGDEANRDHLNLLVMSATTELQGIMEAVSQQSVRLFSEGVLVDRRPPQISRQIIDRIRAVGVVRSRGLANYTIVKAHATGTLDVLEQRGVTRVATVPESVPRMKLGDAKKKKKPTQKEIKRAFRAERLFKKTPVVNVLTAEDDLVCPKCEDIADNGPYLINRARALIPAHINCRCVFIPYTGAEEDEEED